jgi:hypothetical protein
MPELPDWATKTPADHLYSLSMFENSDASIEEVHVSRDEYIALKAHLAALRGYGNGDDPQGLIEAISGKPITNQEKLFFSRDRQQIADQILIARGIYRLCPTAVVYDERSLVEQLRRLANES